MSLPAVPSPSKASSFLSRKVFGVPVLYLALGFVLILAVYAWKTKAATPADATTPAESAGDTIVNGNDLPAVPLGTVVADNGTATEITAGTSISDNDEWLRQGVMFLSGESVSPGAAQEALTLYLDGENLSYEQGYYRDAVIRKLGMPPTPPATVGTTTTDIGRAQGPIPRDHIVKNANENTPVKLAQIYYHRADNFAVQTIYSANGNRATYNVGDVIRIPRLPTPGTPAVPVTTVVSRGVVPTTYTGKIGAGNPGPLPPK